MEKLQFQSADELRGSNPTSSHSERSAAESKNPAASTDSFITGFLDFAWNDSKINP